MHKLLLLIVFAVNIQGKNHMCLEFEFVEVRDHEILGR